MQNRTSGKTPLILVLITLLFTASAFAQLEEDGITGEELRRDFKIVTNEATIRLWYGEYSKDNLARVKEIIATSAHKNEWEGRYSDGDVSSTGVTFYFLDFEKGFAVPAYDSCYPALTGVSYGQLVNNPDSIDFIYEFSSKEKAKAKRYVKVRWDDRLYLVEENALLAFAEKAVGILVPDAEGNVDFAWMSHIVQGDWDKPAVGFPVFPAKYKRFERRPIAANIAHVAARKIVSEKDDNGKVTSRSAVYLITLDAGLNKKIKRGMSFAIPGFEDKIKITKVVGNKAVGTLTRFFDDDDTEVCRDDELGKITCPVATRGMKVGTVVDAMYF